MSYNDPKCKLPHLATTDRFEKLNFLNSSSNKKVAPCSCNFGSNLSCNLTQCTKSTDVFALSGIKSLTDTLKKTQ